MRNLTPSSDRLFVGSLVLFIVILTTLLSMVINQQYNKIDFYIQTLQSHGITCEQVFSISGCDWEDFGH
jgi:hypothetical protein